MKFFGMWLFVIAIAAACIALLAAAFFVWTWAGAKFGGYGHLTVAFLAVTGIAAWFASEDTSPEGGTP